MGFACAIAGAAAGCVVQRCASEGPRGCKGNVWRTVLAAVAMAAVSAALWRSYGIGLELVELWGFSLCLLWLAITDLERLVIPNACVAVAAALRLAFLAVEVALGHMTLAGLWGQLGAALGFGACLLAFTLAADQLLHQESLGGGDLKLLVVAALYFGWTKTLLLLALASVLGIATSAVMALQALGRGEGWGGLKPFPFGPALSLACVATMLWTDRCATLFALS